MSILPKEVPPEKRGWRLTREQVRDIKLRREAGEKNCDLAAEFGVTRGAITDISKWRTWKDLGGRPEPTAT